MNIKKTHTKKRKKKEKKGTTSKFLVPVACSKYLTENPHILGATIQNVATTATWNPGIMHLR
jgi:hypothetical protein